MESFGAYLKQLREEKGISKEDISSRTKISLKYLNALEEGDLGGIPNEVFARGFIRSYARCLALEEQDVLSRFEELAASYYHQKVEQSKTEQHKENQQKESIRRKQLLMQWGTGLAVFAVAVGLFIQNTIEHRNRQMPDVSEAKPQAPETEEQPMEMRTVNPPKVQDEKTPITADQNAEASPPVPLTINPPRSALSHSPETAAVPISPPETLKKQIPVHSLTLKVEAVEKGWVLVKIDDAVIKEVILDPGEKVDWTAHKQFRLSLENAGGVKVEFNGKLLDPLGPRGVVVKDIVLTRD
jgi:cytoskeleton protein RodZ